MQQVTYVKNEDGTFVKTIVETIEVNGKGFEINRLKELKGDLERRKTEIPDEQVEIKEGIKHYEEQLSILES